MTGANWQKAKQIFLRLRDASPERRFALLEEACGDDAALRAEVASLLDHDANAASFLEEPALQLRTGANELVAPQDSFVGRRIGGYEILRELAAGGMGVVYEARQEHPERIVALKVARVGLGSTSARRRFAHEAEILARLQHPNIAQVYEAGTYDEGGTATPFFVMELVKDAQPITNYATTHDLSTLDRLRLFTEVCDAVHYGHQKSIVHRDLKPGNILIDGDGRPKVIDFGVARVVDPDGTIAGTQTSSGQMLGTLQYMSPEQFDGDPLAVDVRSDVYSLGIVLFELLCGELPYDVTTSGLVEAARTIRQQPPRQPSSCLRELRGDIETIILRCLDKTAERRYASVAELAADIRRHLRHEPIEARRDSAIYVLRKNLYRHRWAAAGLLITVAAVVAIAWAAVARQSAAEANTRAALSLARGWIRDGAPLAASELLWSEFFRDDAPRTRFALWELYLNYPRVLANGEYGEQTDVEYAPSGRWLAAVTREHQLVLYDAQTGEARVGDATVSMQVTTVAFAPTAPWRLYLGASDGRTYVCPFDDQAGRIEEPLYCLPDAGCDEPASGPVARLELSDCGRWLIVGRDTDQFEAEGTSHYRNAALSLWDLETQTLVWLRAVPQRLVRGLSFSPDAEQIAIAFTAAKGQETSGTEIWTRDGRCAAWTAQLGRTPRRGAVFTPDGQFVFSIDDHLRRTAASREGGVLEEVQCEAVSRWGLWSLVVGRGAAADYLAFASGDGLIRIYDAARDELLPPLGYHDCNQSPVQLAFSPDGRHLASVGPDGLSVWRFRPGQWVGKPDFRASVEAVATAPLTVAIVHAKPEQWAGYLSYDGRIGLEWNGPGRQCALSESGTRFALQTDRYSPSDDPQHALGGPSSLLQPPFVTVFEAPEWRPLVAPPLTIASPATVLHWLDQEGRYLLLGLEDGRTLLWDVDRTARREASALHEMYAFDTECTRFTNDRRGEWLAACSEGVRDERPAQVCLWQGTGQSLEQGFAQAYRLHSVFEVPAENWHVSLVHDDGGRLLAATAGNSRNIHLWNALRGTEVGELRGHSDAIRHLFVLDDGRLISGSEDGSVRLWDVSSRQELCVLHRQETGTPSVAVVGDTIVICDGNRLHTLDMRDVDMFIECKHPHRSKTKI